MTQRAPRNRTLTCNSRELSRLSDAIRYIDKPATVKELTGRVISGDFFEAAKLLPAACVYLLILDPPYNLSKNFNGHPFKEKEQDKYQRWFQNVIERLMPTLKPTTTIYVCADWKTSALIVPTLEANFHIQNRITWERDKGRGAKSNWKNNTEDIWFCTVSDNYYFDVDSVKLKRKIIAPYRVNGKPKGWNEEENGNYRLTHPSNIWTDITIPFWSMSENTDHPTQKPEKLIAQLILASSREKELVFDPFLGSGTTAVVAKKLNRNYFGIARNKEYCCWALKRLEAVENDSTIQGYTDGIFWERNSLKEQPGHKQQPAKQKETEL